MDIQPECIVVSAIGEPKNYIHQQVWESGTKSPSPSQQYQKGFPHQHDVTHSIGPHIKSLLCVQSMQVLGGNDVLVSAFYLWHVWLEVEEAL